mmetsp:Transcript_18402/g.32712  ORF Transcript_18402/g.32712 Transcript_18402/m.32712 type:complete len:82 (+) Transcript_18402:377-622(+)
MNFGSHVDVLMNDDCPPGDPVDPHGQKGQKPQAKGNTCTETNRDRPNRSGKKNLAGTFSTSTTHQPMQLCHNSNTTQVQHE